MDWDIFVTGGWLSSKLAEPTDFLRLSPLEIVVF